MSNMASTLEYQQLLRGLDKQHRIPKRTGRTKSRAKAVYPGPARTRSHEPLGSIDEIIMESDFSDSAVSPPPPQPISHRRRPSTPRNFSRPDPQNSPPRLSREHAPRAPTKDAVELPVRSAKDRVEAGPSQNGVQAMSSCHANDPFPDEPTFDLGLDSDEDDWGPRYPAQTRPEVYARQQRYEPRPSSARSPASAWSQHSHTDWPGYSRSSSRASTTHPRPLSAMAINQTPALLPLHSSDRVVKFSSNSTEPLPPPSSSSSSSATARDKRPRPSVDRQRVIYKRISMDQRSEHFDSDMPTATEINTMINSRRVRTPDDRSHPFSYTSRHDSSTTTTTSSSSQSRRSHHSDHSNSNNNNHNETEPERPPCWTGSDFDFVGVLTEKEIAKLRKKGINPALYAEMQAAKNRGLGINGGDGRGGGEGREGEGGAARGTSGSLAKARKKKWIGPLVGNTYTG